MGEKKVLFSPRDDELALTQKDSQIKIEGMIKNKKPAEKYPHLLSANVAGQGTGDSHIALLEDKHLVVILPLVGKLPFEKFRHRIEEMVNCLEFWQQF